MTIDLPEAPNKRAAAQANTTQPELPLADETPVAETLAAEHAASEVLELELIDQLWTAYRGQLEASLAQQSAAIAAENAKVAYEAAKEKTEVRRADVKTLLDSFCERLAAIRDPQSAAIIAQVKTAMQTDSQGDSQDEAGATEKTDSGVTSMDWNEWCKIPTETITKGIPGLGAKKAERLTTDFPTLGDLEAARTEFSKQHKHFCKALGKGFGETTADAIESAMHDLLRIPKNATKPTSSAQAEAETPTRPQTNTAADTHQTSDDEQPAAVLQLDETQPDEVFSDGEVYEDMDGESIDDIYSDSLPDSGPDDVSGDTLDDGELVELDDSNEHEDIEGIDEDNSDSSDDEEFDDDETTWADSCFQSLLTDPTETKNGWGDSDKKHSEAWTKGNNAQADWPVSACPYDESTELKQATDWVRGWTAAAMLTMDI